MCEINGHSFWTYVRPAPSFLWNAKHLAKKDDDAVKRADEEKRLAEERMAKLKEPEVEGLEGEVPAPVAPVKTQGTGINNTSKLGLNLI